MIALARRYLAWLHLRWPAGTVEKLPLVNEDGSTNVPGMYVVGDISGVPLLKFAAHTGARAVQTIAASPSFLKRDTQLSYDAHHVFDLVIVGAGVSGIAAALEARQRGLGFKIIEAAEPFSTIANFPKAKPIFTYPTDMTPAGELQFSEGADVKESLLWELRSQAIAGNIEPVAGRAERVVRRGSCLEVVVSGAESFFAHRVIVAVGRSGNFRRLGVPGENLDKVYNRLHDPKDFSGRDVLVVGGGDSALETAIAVASCGGRVTVSYRRTEFSRPKPDNIDKLNALLADPSAEVAVEHPVSERVTTASGAFLGPDHEPGSINVMMGSRLKEIRDGEVVITDHDGRDQSIRNDAVFAMIGREPPLDFFRRSGVRLRGEWRAGTYAGLMALVLFCVFIYHWKKDAGIPVYRWFQSNGWFPHNVPATFDALGGAFAEAAGQPTSFLYTLKTSMAEPSFYYTLAYCLCVVIFGIRRIKRRKTPYVKLQTLVLMAVQCLPLFVLPELLLPWAGRNGWFTDGTASWIADRFFERYDAVGLERAWWRAYGLVLAWPLFVWNIFTDQPLWGWLVLGTIQTFVLIPAAIYFWGKGAYCGWICSCGALAETLGDAHRHKMPHGPLWNRLNTIGQVVLAFALLLLAARLAGWLWPGSVFDKLYHAFVSDIPVLNYKWFVDLLLAGIVGLSCYFFFSGRVWCRFACPLAALMHIYTRFSRFRILADKKKCISCNVCTSVCHQGIDIMNFANKGLPMEDPQCVRCSACVQSCPTGVLTFGQIDRSTGRILHVDSLPASPVQTAESLAGGNRA
jgi:thioredoxin reductase/ferredoxin